MNQIQADVVITKVFASSTTCKFGTLPATFSPSSGDHAKAEVDGAGNLFQSIPQSSSVDATVFSIYMIARGWTLDPNTPIFVTTTDFNNCDPPKDPTAPFPGGIRSKFDGSVLQLTIPKWTSGSNDYYYAILASNPKYNNGTPVWLHPKIRNDTISFNPRTDPVHDFIAHQPYLAIGLVAIAVLVIGLYIGRRSR